MAHEIDITDGHASFASARQDAWHRLGTTLDRTMTADEALGAAHLTGWNVRKAPLTLHETTLDEDGAQTHEVAVPERYATIRTNPINGGIDYLGIVGEQYTPVQNEAHADMLTNLAHDSGAVFETAGALRGGREVFLTMRMPQHLTVGGVDPVDLYIAALNSHDGSRAFRFVITPVRIVCANTQYIAEARSKGSYSMRHTANIGNRLHQAREALGLAVKGFEDFESTAERMIQETLTTAEFTASAERILKLDRRPVAEWTAGERRKISELEGLFAGSSTNAEIRGTAWAGFQAFTEWLDHYSPVHAKGGDAAAIRAEKVALGGGEALRGAAFEAMAV